MKAFGRARMILGSGPMNNEPFALSPSTCQKATLKQEKLLNRGLHQAVRFKPRPPVWLQANWMKQFKKVAPRVAEECEA